MAAEIKEEYTSSLADLTMNSKPLINVLTMLAEENLAHAADIVEAIVTHLEKVRNDYKLPVLYLVDSIIKNVGGAYTNLFTQTIVPVFIAVFKKVDERTRAQMYKLRQTWNEVFPLKKLYALDVQVFHIDPAWPITAPTPTASHTIHVNPKFFNKPKVAATTSVTTATANTPTTSSATPTIVSKTTVNSTAVDPHRQKQLNSLNIKKLELLELEQKKKELALLQQSIQQLEKRSLQKPAVQLLLKPEVAKQLESLSPLTQIVPKTESAALGKLKTTRAPVVKVQNNHHQPVGPRLQTVLTANALQRPAVRDPRLLKQQAEANLCVESNVFHDNVSLVDRNKVKNTITVDCATNNKTLNNKPSARSSTFTPRDPRLVHSKADDGKSSNSSRRSSPSKSTSTSPRKSSSKSSRSKATNSSSESSKNNSPSSKKGYKDDSIGENAARTSRSPSKSPSSKHKKRDGGSSTHDEKRSKSSKSDSKSSSSRRSGVNKDISGDSTTAGFKDLKGSTKNRNYMRRNRAVSASPDPSHDVDLRVGGPPDKQPRLQESASVVPSTAATTTTTTSSETLSKSLLDHVKDVDLRRPAVVTKKRTSTEIMEANFAKKSKSEKMDMLFGNEDVDLRTLTSAQPQQIVDRPPTPPPPPIISSGKKVKEDKMKIPSKPVETSKPDLNALRAKLANATGKGPKQFPQSRINLLEQQKENARNSEDTDMRHAGLNGTNEDSLNKIIISAADEQSILTGNVSAAQYHALINKVVEHFEINKLREAQRRDSENLTNISLQPISDDELSADFSHSESEDEKEKPKEKKDTADKDDYSRKRPAASSQPVTDDSRSREKRNNADTKGETRTRKHNRWAPITAPGVRRRKWDSPPPPHPEPWLRPPMPMHPYGPWRPVAPGPPTFIRPPGIPDTFHNIGMTEPPPALPQVPVTIPEYVRVDSPPALGLCTIDLPPANPAIVDMIEKDTMKNIQIDKIPRDIRYYDDVAVCIMNWDDPRQILFQNGSAMITFNEKESYVLNFNEAYKEILISGKPHKVKFGAPTREIYIDGNFYDCQFGGPGVGIEIDGNMIVVKLEGQTPQVKIGQPRKDLVAGKINLIIDARSMIPIFLDAKPQRFDIEGKVHTLRFADALQTVLINEVPFKVEFGGLPKPIQVYERKHFIRFSVLPRGIKPGLIKIRNMQGYQPAVSPVYNDDSQDVALHETSGEFDMNTPALPMVGLKKSRPIEKDASSDRNSPLIGNLLQQSNFGGLDVLSSVVGSTIMPSNNFSGYSVENSNNREAPLDLNENSSPLPPGTEPTRALNTAPNVQLPLNLNINDLFQKLVESGIVTSNAVEPSVPTVPSMVPLPTNIPPPVHHNTMLPPMMSMQPTNVPPPMLPIMHQHPSQQKSGYARPQQKKLTVSPVLFSQPETLKVRQSSIITSLYTGMQCSSCGVRFPPEQSMYYSQHLDWHFRQNRRGKNSIRKAMSRRWYYSLSDWKNYEEIEDLEEREKSWFENQQQQQLEAGAEEQEEEVEIPSVPATADVKEACCEVCRDKFDQFYNEEKEEWHLRMAVRVDDKTYHPLCYEDHKNSLIAAEAAALEAAEKAAADKHDDTLNETESISEDDIKIIEKDIEVITVLDTSEKEREPVENEEANNASDDSMKEEAKADEGAEKMETDKGDELTENKDEDDDDVIIHEVVPEKIDIANDDDDLEKDYMGLIPGVVVKEEPIDDDFMDVDEVKIRNDTIDTDLHCVQKVNTVSADTTLAGMVSSIDGNVQLQSGISPSAGSVGGKIKINITKPIIAPVPKEPVPAAESELASDNVVDPNQPLPPGEEPVQLNLKPALQGLTLKKQPLVKRGSELTGLCSIM